MWIVMSASASMPSRCRGNYRRVALVEISQEYAANNWSPAMISTRALGVLRVIDLGKFSVGKTTRSAFYVARAAAEQRAMRLNNAAPTERPELIVTWGGSA